MSNQNNSTQYAGAPTPSIARSYHIHMNAFTHAKHEPYHQLEIDLESRTLPYLFTIPEKDPRNWSERYRNERK